MPFTVIPVRLSSLLLFLFLSFSLSLSASAQSNTDTAASDADPVEGESSTEEPQATRKATRPEQDADRLTFDPADIGLPALPRPMVSAEDFSQTVTLIDSRLAELEAEAERTDAADDGPGEGLADGLDEDPDAERADADAGKAPADEATRTGRIELLRSLRATVQRRALLKQRLGRLEDDLAEHREQLTAIEQNDDDADSAKGLGIEPPYTVSQLDRQQAELGLTEAAEAVAETRLETATRRLSASEKALAAAVRARRAARDRLTAASDEGRPEAEREALAQSLELARLQELLARQQAAAAEDALTLARQEDRLSEARQELLQARVEFLESRAQLSPEMLEQRLEELDDTERRLRDQIDTLLGQADEAESALFQAQRRLADARENAGPETGPEAGPDSGPEAGPETDRAALTEWVAARQSELDAINSAVDSLTVAIADIDQMRRRWQQRFELMQSPDTEHAAEQLREIINAATTARAGKDEIEGRLNALRTMQLTQARRLREPDLGQDLREALETRTAAQELAERHGRELLETRDALIALLVGMRHQLQQHVDNEPLSLQLLEAQEALVDWWDAELIVINDQSITAGELVTALAMFALVLIVVPLIRLGAGRALRRRRVKNRNTQAGDLRLVLSAIAGNTSQLFVLIAAFYVAMVFSGLASPTVRSWLWTALVIAFYAQLGLWANAAMVDYFNRRRTRQEMRDPSTVTGYGVLMFFIRIGIWISVLVSLLTYFEYPVAGLIGALGVGSLAVAFAVQNILGDVFSSMAIILDKPFRVGDFIKAGDTLGTIELIGVKTTRIRSLSGEQVVISNSDLLNSRVHNFKHFSERRITFGIRVVYWTSPEQIEHIPQMIREAIERQPQTRFDRAHFARLGESCLEFDVVYFVLTPDYGVYMDIQQAVNRELHRRFQESGIAFAYPTQAVIVHGGPHPIQAWADAR
ncbi:MAG: mechanosensitive ion channel [Thiohalocapsa sp.]|nr:mechanosensitive ion channel [Thiohalocapsa sp.]